MSCPIHSNQGKGKVVVSVVVSSGRNHHQSSSRSSSQAPVTVHRSSNWSGQSQTQNGKTSSSWVHQGSKVQLDVSRRGSQVSVKQQIVRTKTQTSKQKNNGFTTEIKRERSARETVTYVINTPPPPSRLRLNPKPNAKPKPKPIPVSQKAVTSRR